MSKQEMKTLTAKCHCGSVHFKVNMPTDALPLPIRMCHCSLCRYSTGAPCIFHTDLPSGVQPQFVAPSSQDKLSSYRLSPDSDLRMEFCSTCGCHIWGAHDEGWAIANSIFTDHGPENFSFKMNCFSASAKDRGIAPMTADFGDRKLGDWNPPADDPRAKITESAPEVGEDGEPRLRVQCHCGGVSFTVKRPSEEVLHDEFLKGFVSPTDPTKWLACLDLCDDCRLVNGTHVAGWMFVAASAIEPSVKPDLLIGTSKTYASSSGTLRSFCGTCGATVFFSCDDRRPSEGRQALDIAIGCVRAPEGVMALDWLHWRSKVGWLDSGKAYDAAFADALQQGLNDWSMKTYGELSTFKIG